MEKNLSLKDAIKLRRTYYSIDNKITASDSELQDIIEFAITNVPSAYNSQSSRIVLLLGDEHKKLWSIVMETLRKKVPADKFQSTEDKINNCFASGYGTILFYEDQNVVKGLQSTFPSYADKFPEYSEHTTAMHQYAIWMLLREQGIGASLQHYSPIIDAEVAETWNIDSSWKLIAQMPFGNPIADPLEKSFSSLEERIKIYK
ncbi:nitroreductase family protein [Dysgonomonas massiliensis]|uniref:nitroreductase family protein n=1 Tax=Dysgonomonas massiliensis TaxID=2040292 RepID=UPI000C76918A|nr:nitroreductase family protein [Dysgonomonas massiliensis]